MKDQRRTEIKVGITVIVGIILFLWVLGWAKNFSIYSDKKELTIRFDSVAGLEVGDPVSVNGVRKGYVDDIHVDKNTVVVKTILDSDTDLRKDADYSVMMLDLMGGKKIEINPGFSSEPLDYSALQTGHFKGDISTAMAMLSSVQGDLVDVIQQVKISLNNLNSLLGDKDFNNELKNTIARFNSLTVSLDDLIKKNQAGITQLISSGNELVGNANTLLTENKDEIKITLMQVDSTLRSSNKLIKKLDSFADEITQKKNNAGKLLYDEDLVNDLKTSMTQIKELTKILIEQLKGKGLNVDANVDLF